MFIFYSNSSHVQHRVEALIAVESSLPDTYCPQIKLSSQSNYSGGADCPISPIHNGRVNAVCCSILIKTPRRIVVLDDFFDDLESGGV